jgi:hypothetical protein
MRPCPKAAVDADYIESMLNKAETQCSMAAHCIAVTGGRSRWSSPTTPRTCTVQTEDVCFEPLELAALGVGLACKGTDRAKGRERLESAAGEASKLNAFLTIAGHGKEALGDQAQVESARPKVDGKAAGADEAAARF